MKVESAISNVLGKVKEGIKQISWQQHEGYYGNIIKSLNLRFDNKSEIANLLREVFARLRPEDKQEIENSLGRRLDGDNNLYLRLDKQAAFLGDICIGADDTIRLQIKFSLPRKQREKALEAAVALLQGVAN